MAIPLATLGPTIDANGISIPTYSDILGTLVAQYQSIYGTDVDLDPDTQDGQWLGIQAAAFNDTNAAIVAAYNQFSPTTAVGVGLSSVVKINGLARDLPSNSTVDLVCVGQAGVTIRGGLVGDPNNQGTQWLLPTFIFPPGGNITVTATATTPGALTAAPNTLTKILNPTAGWQSANNPSSAAAGDPIETDAQLRQRQAYSTGNNAITPKKALTGNVLALPGVMAVANYENVGSTTDANGLPGHSISLVVAGGDAAAIASVILNKKTEGAGTYGTTTEVVDDYAGVPTTINFFRPTLSSIQVQVSLKALAGFSTAIEFEIQAAVAAYINGLGISAGGNGGAGAVDVSKVNGAANLNNNADSTTFKILANGITLGKNGGSMAATDVTIAFNEQPTCVTTDVTFVVS